MYGWKIASACSQSGNEKRSTEAPSARSTAAARSTPSRTAGTQ